MRMPVTATLGLLLVLAAGACPKKTEPTGDQATPGSSAVTTPGAGGSTTPGAGGTTSAPGGTGAGGSTATTGGSAGSTGTAPPAGGGIPCGPKTCSAGQVCCNASCGICTPPDGVCTQQLCSDPGAGADGGGATAGPACKSDGECRLFSDYCTGCDCRALLKTDKDPLCSGPGVRCFADPCQNKAAACQNGRCAVVKK